MNREKLQKQVEKIKRAQSSDRFKKIISFLDHKGLLISNTDFPYKDQLDITDALWAATYEPRILEVLPAAIIHFPTSIEKLEKLPRDLHEIIDAIKIGLEFDVSYKGITYRSMKRWADLQLKDKRTKPLAAKKKQMNFRLQPEVVEKLRSISKVKNITITEVVEELVLKTG